jgi:hypothetical protein
VHVQEVSKESLALLEGKNIDPVCRRWISGNVPDHSPSTTMDRQCVAPPPGYCLIRGVRRIVKPVSRTPQDHAKRAKLTPPPASQTIRPAPPRQRRSENRLRPHWRWRWRWLPGIPPSPTCVYCLARLMNFEEFCRQCEGFGKVEYAIEVHDA